MIASINAKAKTWFVVERLRGVVAAGVVVPLFFELVVTGDALIHAWLGLPPSPQLAPIRAGGWLNEWLFGFGVATVVLILIVPSKWLHAAIQSVVINHGEKLKVEEDDTLMMEEDMPVVTTLYTTKVTLFCPHCGKKDEGFLMNPAGLESTCSHCERKYRVHKEPDIEYGP